MCKANNIFLFLRFTNHDETLLALIVPHIPGIPETLVNKSAVTKKDGQIMKDPKTLALI